MSNFGAFYYMFIVNVGVYKEPEFAPTKIHQKLKQKHAFYLENTKIVQSVCTEVLFVLDWKKTQVKNVFPIQISVFSAAQLSHTGRSMRQIVAYESLILTTSNLGLLSIHFRLFITELWPLNNIRISFPLNILRMNEWSLTKFCLCIDIDTI